MNKYIKIISLLTLASLAALGGLFIKKRAISQGFIGQICPITKQYENVRNTALFKLWQDYHLFQVKKAGFAIKEEFGIPENHWQGIMNQVKTLKEKDPLFNLGSVPGISAKKTHPDHPFTKKVIEVLVKNGLNPRAVEITFDESSPSPASATQRYQEKPEYVQSIVLINPKLFGKRDALTQEAILFHEVIHLIHYDPIEEGYIIGFLRDMGYTEKDWDKALSMVKYRQAKELRADQLGAIRGGTSIAQAMKDDLSKIKWHDETITHPASRVRVAQINVVQNHQNAAAA